MKQAGIDDWIRKIPTLQYGLDPFQVFEKRLARMSYLTGTILRKEADESGAICANALIIIAFAMPYLSYIMQLLRRHG
jgi:hypothetical protein